MVFQDPIPALSILNAVDCKSFKCWITVCSDVFVLPCKCVIKFSFFLIILWLCFDCICMNFGGWPIAMTWEKVEKVEKVEPKFFVLKKNEKNLRQFQEWGRRTCQPISFFNF